jgi:hypothetical protein
MVSEGPGFQQRNLTRVRLVSFCRKVYRLAGAEQLGPLCEALTSVWPCQIMTAADLSRRPEKLAYQPGMPCRALSAQRVSWLGRSLQTISSSGSSQSVDAFR